MDENEPSWEGEGVQIVGVDDAASYGHLDVRVPGQGLTKPVHIFADQRIVEHAGLALYFFGQLLAERDFLLERVKVDALAHIAIADFVDVLLLVLLAERGESEGGGEEHYGRVPMQHPGSLFGV